MARAGVVVILDEGGGHLCPSSRATASAGWPMRATRWSPRPLLPGRRARGGRLRHAHRVTRRRDHPGRPNAMAALLRRDGATKVGVTGFCMGGRWTWRSAVWGEGFDAAVGFYGGGIAQDLGQPTIPTLLFFGGQDEWIPTSDIEAVESHHQNTITYPEAGHRLYTAGRVRQLPSGSRPRTPGPRCWPSSPSISRSPVTSPTAAVDTGPARSSADRHRFVSIGAPGATSPPDPVVPEP